MTRAASVAVQHLAGYLQANDGLASRVAALASLMAFELPLIEPEQIRAWQAGSELLEKSQALKYPLVLVYAERIRNEQREKFRRFSGTVDVVVEVRLTHDRLEELEGRLGAYVDAVTDVLHRRRGEWSSGVFHTGSYEVVMEPVKRGGAHFAQRARVVAQVFVSVS